MNEDKHFASRLSGNYFQPYSVLVDGQSLACYYTQIHRQNKETGETAYPLSIVLTNTHFSIYWNGYSQRPGSGPEWNLYGVHQLFADDFTDQYNAPIEEWLDQGRLVSPEVLDGKPYSVIDNRDNKNSYRGTYFQNPWHYEIKKEKSLWDKFRIWIGKIWATIMLFFAARSNATKLEQIVFENFILDLLFDLKHSSVFLRHPARDNFIGFLEKVDRINAIWKKAEHRYSLFQLAKQDAKEQRVSQKQQINFLSDVHENTTTLWLAFLRSPAGEKSTKDSKTDNWFLGVEAEHRAVFKASKAKHLNKQAEDSIQWLIGRYALGHAYWLQALRVFGWRSVLILALSTFGYLIVEGFWPKTMAVWRDASQFHWAFDALLATSRIVLFLFIGLLFERLLTIAISCLGWVIHRITNNYFSWKPLEQANPEAVLLSIPKIANLLKPKILLASTAAWALILSADFVWDLDFRLSLTKWIILGLLAFVTFIFMATHIAPLLERKWKGRKVLFRIFILGFFSSIYSFMIGFVGMAATAEKRFVKEEQLPQYFEEFQIKEHKGDFASNTDGNYVYLGKTPTLKPLPEFADSTVGFATIFEKEDPTGKKVFEKELSSSKWLTYNGLPKLYHHCGHGEADSVACLHRKACLITKSDFSLDNDHSLDVHHLIIIVAEPLVFFTFVAVALGLMLEMGLQLNRAGIGIE